MTEFAFGSLGAHQSGDRHLPAIRLDVPDAYAEPPHA
jgi:hypothetical protein